MFFFVKSVQSVVFHSSKICLNFCSFSQISLKISFITSFRHFKNVLEHKTWIAAGLAASSLGWGKQIQNSFLNFFLSLFFSIKSLDIESSKVITVSEIVQQSFERPVTLNAMNQDHNV